MNTRKILISKAMRVLLLATGLMNLCGSLIFVPQITVFRQMFGLPIEESGLYLWIIAVWIFLFGTCYLWLALTGRREPLFIFIAACGKFSFALLLAIYYLAGAIPLLTALAGTVDLSFAVIFFNWLVTNSKEDF